MEQRDSNQVAHKVGSGVLNSSRVSTLIRMVKLSIIASISSGNATYIPPKDMDVVFEE